VKRALLDGVTVHASPGAPPEATCPRCGEPVELRGLPGTPYYRHVPGAGANCPLRKKPIREQPRRPQPMPSLPEGDPRLVLVVATVVRALDAARRGSLPAILDLAFSRTVHLALDWLDLTPGELLDHVAPGEGGDGLPELLLVTEDEARVLEAVRRQPAPVLDVRSWHDGHLRELEELDGYVPLWPIGPARLRLLRRVLGRLEEVYVLGTPGEWAEVVGRARSVEVSMARR
jgi:hypothetical protein